MMIYTRNNAPVRDDRFSSAPHRSPLPRHRRSRSRPETVAPATTTEERGTYAVYPHCRVFVAGADPLVRAGIAAVVERSATLDLADTAPGLADLAPRTDHVTETVIVADVTSDDLDRLDRLPPVLHVASAVTDAWLLESLWAGVRGVLLHRSVEPLLHVAVTAALAGGVLVDPALTPRLIEMAARGRPAEGPTDLTVQELRVVRRLPAGWTNREIAADLGLSPQTVKGHLRRAMRKLGARSRVEAARIAREAGILDENA